MGREEAGSPRAAASGGRPSGEERPVRSGPPAPGVAGAPACAGVCACARGCGDSADATASSARARSTVTPTLCPSFPRRSRHHGRSSRETNQDQNRRGEAVRSRERRRRQRLPSLASGRPERPGGTQASGGRGSPGLTCSAGGGAGPGRSGARRCRSRSPRSGARPSHCPCPGFPLRERRGSAAARPSGVSGRGGEREAGPGFASPSPARAAPPTGRGEAGPGAPRARSEVSGAAESPAPTDSEAVVTPGDERGGGGLAAPLSPLRSRARAGGVGAV